MKEIDQLIIITGKIISIQHNIDDYLEKGGSIEDWSFKNMVDSYQILIKQEQDILNSFNQEGLEKMFTIINSCYKPFLITSIIKAKILASMFLHDTSKTVDAKCLGIDNPKLQEQQFAMHDVVNAIPKILALGKLKRLIGTFNQNGHSDIDLNKELKYGTIALVNFSPFFETLLLSFYGKIPDLDLHRIGNNLKSTNQKKESYDNELTKISKSTINNLKPYLSKDYTLKIDYKAHDIYLFFFTIYQLEILAPYIPEDLLHELETLFNRPVTIGRFEFEPISTKNAIKKALKK